MSELQAALIELQSLDRALLCERWTSAFGSPAPHRAQEPMLRRVIAWHLQMRASPEWRSPSALQALVRSLQSGPVAPTLSPGIRLLRQWKDRTHQVTVLDKGFEYEGVPYRSLSAIAHRITGTSWSGPAFFGIRT